MGRLQRYFYTLLLYIGLPFIALRHKWNSRLTPENRPDWFQRFGWYQQVVPKKAIWLHAVSVGEVMAAAPFAERILSEFPDRPLIITTMTRTGADRVKALFGKRVHHLYAPFDLPGAARRFFKHIDPHVGLIFETEIWPNWLLVCRQRKTPVFLLNARLSERSEKGYKFVGAATKVMLQGLAGIAAQTADDARRLIGLGAPENIVSVTGSSKFSMSIKPEQKAAGGALREKFGTDKKILIAASTHEGEDEIILRAFEKVKSKYINTSLIIVPRHPARFNNVVSLCEKTGFTVSRRSKEPASLSGTDIFVVDSMGEMLIMYSASDIAFVAGSLIPIGGHNVLEAAAAELPIIVGPHIFNFQLITEELLDVGGGIQIKHESALSQAIIDLLDHPEKADQMGKAAKSLLSGNRGTLDKFMALVKSSLN